MVNHSMFANMCIMDSFSYCVEKNFVHVLVDVDGFESLPSAGKLFPFPPTSDFRPVF